MEKISEYLNSTVDDMIIESTPSDDTILYWLGCRMLNWKQNDMARKTIRHYHIDKNNPRPGVLRYIKDQFPPIINSSKEIIPRSQWDLDSLIGETEHQLMHEAYYEATNYILQHFKPKHDVLTIFQCSSAKPYYANRAYHYNVVKPYGEFSDFACISNPGLIPYEYSDRYPFRYDEWNITKEAMMKDIINLTEKYRIVNMCRVIRYVKKMGYKHCLIYIPNKRKQVLFERIIDHDVDGMGDKFQIVITDHLRDTLYNKPKYSKMKTFLSSRMVGFEEVNDAYARLLKSVSKDKDAIADAHQKRKEELEEARRHRGVKEDYEDEIDYDYELPVLESLSQPEYKMLESLSYEDVMRKFKDIIEDNMKDPSVDKGDNNLLYRSYYWTALDLVLYGLDGNLVEDIDKAYWDIRKKLDGDDKWIKLSSCIYAYKPLMDNDSVKIEDIEKEADKLKMIWHKSPKRVNPVLFK